MPKTRVVFYCDDDGGVPLLDWFDALPDKARTKCRVRIERLQELGHDLRRPEADYVQNGVYELRVRFQSVNYRMLYFFYGNVAAVLSHGLTKERELPPRDVARAIERKAKFEADPERHTYKEA